MDEEYDAFIDDLYNEMLADGSIKDYVMDESGEFEFLFDMDTVKSLHPIAYEAIVKVQEEEISIALGSLIEQGLIEETIRVNDDNEPEIAYRLTEMGNIYAESLGDIPLED